MTTLRSELPDDATIVDCIATPGEDPSRWIWYTWYLCGPDGAGFCLYREPHHTHDDVEACKKWLRNHDDVVTLRVEPMPPNTFARRR